MDFTFTPEQDELREQARVVPRREPRAVVGGARRARLDGRLDRGGGRRRRAHVRRGGRALRGARPRALPRAVLLHDRRSPFPRCPSDLRAEVAAGTSSWTLALGPLVPDLDTAEQDRRRRRRRHLRARGRASARSSRRSTRPGRSASCAEARRRAGSPTSTVLAEIEARSLTALALEACGVARKALEYALEYASSREQFGRRIGVYQAVSHPLATSYTRLELSRSLALWAAWCVVDRRPAGGARRGGREGVGSGERGRRLRGVDPDRSAASASRGSTSSTVCTSAPSGSRASGPRARGSGPRSPRALIEGEAPTGGRSPSLVAASLEQGG